MITKIVAKLKEGTIKNVVPYGMAGNMPAAPYIVVKQESDPLGRGDIYRVIIHVAPGAHIFLKQYMANAQALLDNFEATTYLGNLQRIYADGPLSGIIVDNDDGTIAMERTYLSPTIFF